MSDTQKTIPSYAKMLFWVTAVNVALLFVRNMVIGDSPYNFLLWNLFLGLVPLLVAWTLQRFYLPLSKLLFILGSCLWLLFYPNAPYMITDMIHVSQSDPIVLYDALILFSFAILSLFFGLYSLAIIGGLYAKKFSRKIAYIVVIGSILLSSFGIYLGRILRLNSWDLFTHPIKTMITVFEHLFPIGQNLTTYTVIVLFSGIQFYLLLLVRDFDRVEDSVAE